jgi:hypothetical protein
MYRYDTPLCLILTYFSRRSTRQIAEITITFRNIPHPAAYLQAGLMLDFEEAGEGPVFQRPKS